MKKSRNTEKHLGFTPLPCLFSISATEEHSIRRQKKPHTICKIFFYKIYLNYTIIKMSPLHQKSGRTIFLGKKQQQGYKKTNSEEPRTTHFFIGQKSLTCILGASFIRVSSSIQKQRSAGESPHKQGAHCKRHTEKQIYKIRKRADVFMNHLMIPVMAHWEVDVSHPFLFYLYCYR